MTLQFKIHAEVTPSSSSEQDVRLANIVNTYLRTLVFPIEVSMRSALQDQLDSFLRDILPEMKRRETLQ